MIIALLVLKRHGLQMLYWKQKPIDQLTKIELQKALSESVSLILSNRNHTNSNELITTFITGIIIGTIIALTGMYLASVL